MEEMTTTGEQHREPKLIASLDGIGITDAAPRVNHGRDAMTGGQTHRVIEWEKAIARQYGAFDMFTGSFEGDASRANTVHLTGPNTKALARFCNDDGVRTNMTNQSPGKFKVLTLLR